MKRSKGLRASAARLFFPPTHKGQNQWYLLELVVAQEVGKWLDAGIRGPAITYLPDHGFHVEQRISNQRSIPYERENRLEMKINYQK